MAILDGNGRRINPNRKRIRVGDLGETNADKEWKKYLYNERNGKQKAGEARQRRKEKSLMEKKQAEDRLKYRGY